MPILIHELQRYRERETEGEEYETVDHREPESQSWGWLSHSPAVPSARRQRRSVEMEVAVQWSGGAVETVNTVAASRHWLRSSKIGSGNVGGE
jgi:hypothetical protein